MGLGAAVHSAQTQEKLMAMMEMSDEMKDEMTDVMKDEMKKCYLYLYFHFHLYLSLDCDVSWDFFPTRFGG